MKYTKTSSQMSSTLLTMLKNGCHGFSILFVFYGFFTARKGWFFACGGFLSKKLFKCHEPPFSLESLQTHPREDEPS